MDGVDAILEILRGGAAVGVIDISQVVGRDKVTVDVAVDDQRVTRAADAREAQTGIEAPERR